MAAAYPRKTRAEDEECQSFPVTRIRPSEGAVQYTRFRGRRCYAPFQLAQSEQLNKIYTSMNRQCHEAYMHDNVLEPAAYERASEQAKFKNHASEQA